MELIGRLIEYKLDGGYLRAVFRCTNGEEFRLLQPKALARLREDELVRVFTQRTVNKDGFLGSETVIVHQEKLE